MTKLFYMDKCIYIDMSKIGWKTMVFSGQFYVLL